MIFTSGDEAAERLFAWGRERYREEKARAQHRNAENRDRTVQRKKLRSLIKEHGILEVLRQCGVGNLDAKAQFELASRAYRWRPFPPFKYEPERADKRSRLSKLQRLAEDPGATDGERQAALAAIERVQRTEATP